MRTAAPQQYQDTRVDVKLVLSAAWIAMVLVFAYVDIFGFYRADILDAALDGKIATTSFAADQLFLTITLIYILVPVLMVVLSLILRPRVNRITNIAVSILYPITIIGSCVGEHWIYYVFGSVVEVVLLTAVARIAWKWPTTQVASYSAQVP